MLTLRSKLTLIFPFIFLFISTDTLGKNTYKLFAEGLAYKKGTNTLLYTERHFETENDFVKIIYSEPDGIEFARKTLEYSLNRTSPMLEQVNSRNGEVKKVHRSLNDKIIVSYKKSSSSETKERLIPHDESLIIDAGFNNYIVNHWQTLVEDKTLKFSFLLPTHRRVVSLSAEKISCSPENLCLKVSPRNYLMKMLSSDLYLTYTKDSKRLIKFSGKSNISDENGKYQVVDIHYFYPSFLDTNSVGFK